METYTPTTQTLAQRAGSRRYYRLMGVMLFCVACALLVVRTLTNFISEYFSSELGLDAFFSIVLQIGVLVIMPTLFYLFAFKMKPREILEFTSIRQTKPVNYVLAVFIGLTGVFVTMGVSTVWQFIIMSLGYTPSSSGSILPDTFNPAIFLLSLFLSAMLPGFCEEFTMRGGYLTTMRRHFSFGKLILIMGISFGLFHQYITQVFYTALFGGLMAALLLRCKSIIPCMIVHFVNNGTSVYLESAEKYGWFGKNFYNNINEMIMKSPASLFGGFILFAVVFVGLVIVFFYLNGTSKDNKAMRTPVKTAPDIFDRMESGNAQTNPTAVTDPEPTQSEYEPAAQTQGQTPHAILSYPQYRTPVCLEPGEPAPDFKPALRDNVFYIGAAVVAAVTTVFTFIWGWVV